MQSSWPWPILSWRLIFLFFFFFQFLSMKLFFFHGQFQRIAEFFECVPLMVFLWGYYFDFFFCSVGYYAFWLWVYEALQCKSKRKVARALREWRSEGNCSSVFCRCACFIVIPYEKRLLFSFHCCDPWSVLAAFLHRSIQQVMWIDVFNLDISVLYFCVINSTSLLLIFNLPALLLADNQFPLREQMFPWPFKADKTSRHFASSSDNVLIANSKSLLPPPDAP